MMEPHSAHISADEERELERILPSAELGDVLRAGAHIAREHPDAVREFFELVNSLPEKPESEQRASMERVLALLNALPLTMHKT